MNTVAASFDTTDTNNQNVSAKKIRRVR